MRLYATIKSERASREATKGGDKKLVIEVTDKGKPLCRLKIWIEDDKPMFELIKNKNGKWEQVITCH